MFGEGFFLLLLPFPHLSGGFLLVIFNFFVPFHYFLLVASFFPSVIGISSVVSPFPSHLKVCSGNICFRPAIQISSVACLQPLTALRGGVSCPDLPSMTNFAKQNKSLTDTCSGSNAVLAAGCYLRICTRRLLCLRVQLQEISPTILLAGMCLGAAIL
jgi:hypothetical protein